MTVIAWEQGESEQIVNSTNWIQVAHKEWTQDRDATEEYFLIINAEYTIANIAQTVQIRVVIDGTEQSIDHFSPEVAGQFRTFCTLVFQQAGLGLHSLALEVRGTSADDITVRRRRLLVIKH